MKQKKRKRKLTALEKLAEKAMQAAAKNVIQENKRFGEPLIVFENGKVRKIPINQV